jgi:hypothetical protein
LQNTKGEGVRSRGVQIGRDERIEQSSLLWEKLVEALPELDRVVVYLGANGSQRAVELAAEKADPKKVTFVSCGCGLLQKELLLEETGLTDVGRVLCECGGHLTMEKLYKDFMAQGTLPTGIPSGE